jgi:hypothetical protein
VTAVSRVGGASSGGVGQYPYSPAAPGRSATEDRGERRPPADWHQALAELEGEVLATEDSLARGRAEEIAAWGRRSGDWIPPQNLGPLPDDLRDRAARLLQHQLAVAEALVERITQSQKQRDVAARMSYAPARPVASYIDRGL